MTISNVVIAVLVMFTLKHSTCSRLSWNSMMLPMHSLMDVNLNSTRPLPRDKTVVVSVMAAVDDNTFNKINNMIVMMEEVEDFAVLIIEIMVPLPGQEIFRTDRVFEVDVMATATVVVIVNYVTVVEAAVLVDLTIEGLVTMMLLLLLLLAMRTTSKIIQTRVILLQQQENKRAVPLLQCSDPVLNLHHAQNQRKIQQ
jgi:hypothetical protein